MFHVQRMFLLVLHVLFVQVYALPTTSHYGTEFYLYGCVQHTDRHEDLVIDIASKHEGTVQLIVPYLNINRNSTLSRGVTTLTVDGTIFKIGTFLENRGILLRTDFPVAVYVTCDPVNDVIDTYLALPITALGTSYKVASYDPYISSDSAFLSIVGVTANTFVTTNFTYTTNKVSHLQQFSVQQFVSTTDLSNTFIVSDNLISVLSGTSCAFVPHAIHACDLLLEHMIPVKYWKKNYIVPPIFPKLGFVLKILTANNETFCLRNNTNTICDTSNGSPQQEFLMGTEPVVVTSQAPISTVQFGLGEDYDQFGGDEFMTVIPAVEHYLNAYFFVVPLKYSSLQSYLSIVIPSSQINGIKLDGYPLTITKQYSVPDPFRNFSVLIANISVGYHELYHTNLTVKFGVTVYGLYTAIGYGFPAGFAFTDTDTSTQTDEMRTCFRCDEMPSMGLCDVIQQCIIGEVCYSEKYHSTHGTFFRSGCMDASVCKTENTTSSDVVCLECCNTDYCNNNGCGDFSFPDRSQRGPICFDCQHIPNDPTKCNKVTLCSSDEVCSVEESKWGDGSQFRMGCTHHLCTPIKRTAVMTRFERSVPVCSSCCPDDFCNRNCTKDGVDHSGPVFVG